MTSQQIEKSYTGMTANDEQLYRIRELRGVSNRLAQLMNAICPNSRELSLALTNLEQACMWAVKAVTHNETDTTSGPV